MIIKKGGRVGIGTNNPTNKLEVIGDVYVSGTIYYGALEANSPHAFLQRDSRNQLVETQLCMVASNNSIVMLTIGTRSGSYELTIQQDPSECLSKTYDFTNSTTNITETRNLFR